MTASRADHQDLRLGTVVSGAGGATARTIQQIMPHGFECFQISFWQTLGGADLPRLAEQTREVLAGTDVFISSLAIFGNPLGDQPVDAESIAAWEACIDAAPDFGCDLVCGFTGRVRGEPVEASLPRFKQVFGDLARRAADRGVRIAFENCPMGGTWKAGDWNIAFAPQAWELMFDALPDEHLGLEWEPCHPIAQIIDPLPQLKKWIRKVFHVHGKDAAVDWAYIAEHGIASREKYYHGRHPGFGDTNWTDVISILRVNGYRGALDIEGGHDPVYRDDLEMTGQVRSLNYLKACRGGDYVPNPE